MTSKSLSFKLVLDEARRNLWALALSVLGFLFAGPLPLLVYLQRELQEADREGVAHAEIVKKLTENFYSLFRNDFPRLGMIIMAILCGVALFRFLHDRRQVDFYHALPIRRERLFWVRFSAGILLVFPAYLFTRLVSLAVIAGMGYGSAIQWGDVLTAVGLDVLAFFLMYSFSILCTVLCGNTFFTVALLFAVLLSLTPVLWIYCAFANWFYPAFRAMDDIEMFSPLVVCLATEDLKYMVPHLIAAAAALALSFVLFRRRRSERAGTALAFKPLQLPLKVYVCVVGGLGFSCILNSIGMYSNGGIWLFLFTAVGAAVLHCVMEIIYQADFRALFRKPQVLAAVTVVSLLLTAGLKADILGYSKWLPAEEQVKRIALDRLQTSFDTDAHHFANLPLYDLTLSEDTNPETKQALLRLAEIGTQNLDIASTDFFRQEAYDALSEQLKRIGGCYSFDIYYTLSGGRSATRRYSIPITDENTALLEQVLYSEYYLRGHNAFFAYEAKKAELAEKGETQKGRIEFWDARRGTLVYTLRDADKLQRLTETLKADLLESDPRQLAREGAAAKLQFAIVTGDNERLYDYPVMIYPSYQRTLALMQEYSGFVPTPLRLDEIERIRVRDYRDRVDSQQEGTDKEMLDYAIDGTNPHLRIVNDPAQMAALLENAVPRENDRMGRRIGNLSLSIALIDGSYTEMEFLSGQAPEELLTGLFGSELLPQPYGDEGAGTRAETAETFW